MGCRAALAVECQPPLRLNKLISVSRSKASLDVAGGEPFARGVLTPLYTDINSETFKIGPYKPNPPDDYLNI